MAFPPGDLGGIDALPPPLPQQLIQHHPSGGGDVQRLLLSQRAAPTFAVFEGWEPRTSPSQSPQLLQHALAQNAVGAGLVSLALGLEPG